MQKPKTYGQKSAQELLVKWLQNEAESVGYDSYVNSRILPPIRWRVNREGPFWGVFPDYPITKTGLGDYDSVWDEYATSSEIVRKDGIPSLNELWNCGLEVETMLDIAIQHKGVIITTIFIDEIPSHAVNFLKSTGISEIAIVQSFDVLNQPLRLCLHDIEKIPVQLVDKSQL